MLFLTIVLRCAHLDRYFGGYHGNFCDFIWNWKCGCGCPATIINGRLITTKSVYLWRYLISAMKSSYIVGEIIAAMPKVMFEND
jgi:hypothetical protein